MTLRLTRLGAFEATAAASAFANDAGVALSDALLICVVGIGVGLVYFEQATSMDELRLEHGGAGMKSPASNPLDT